MAKGRKTERNSNTDTQADNAFTGGNARPANGKSHPSRVKDSAADTSSKQSMNEAFDKDLYDGGKDKYAGYNTSISAMDVDDDFDAGNAAEPSGLVPQYTASKAQLNEFAHGATEETDKISSREKNAQIQSRESDWQKRRFNRDPFENQGLSHREIMERKDLEREEARVKRAIAAKEKDAATNGQAEDGSRTPVRRESGSEKENFEVAAGRKRKNRWDVPDANNDEPAKPAAKRSRWDSAPAPGATKTKPKTSRWDDGPTAAADTAEDEENALEKDMALRQQIIDEELNILLPGEDKGFKIVPPPESYQPIRKNLAATSLLPGFMFQNDTGLNKQHDRRNNIPGIQELQFFKDEDMQYFGKLADQVDEDQLSFDELRERKVARLLLKVKNGTPPARKTALRQLTDGARSLGGTALFNQLLPLLMERTLEEQERHLLVKVVGRILYKLDEMIRPHVRQILTVVEPLLLDQDYYARVEGREIISNLAKSAGLATMIATMRPELDSEDDFVRHATAKSFAVVAVALGVPSVLPFLGAVCRSKKSWQARHTGVRVVMYIATFLGCAVLPVLKDLVECIQGNVTDEQMKVRTQSSEAIASLAQAAAPYGVDGFDSILKPLWSSARSARGRTLTSALKAVGCIIPLMTEEHAAYYTERIMAVILREYASADDDMKRTVLRVTSQCILASGVKADYIKANVVDKFFDSFWVRRMALERSIFRQVVTSTVDLAKRVGAGSVVKRIVTGLWDESEPFRKMTLETIDKTLTNMGAASIDERTEEQLIEGLLETFGRQTSEDITVLNGFAAVINALGPRCKKYLPNIASVILFRLENKNYQTRMQAADLVARIAPVLQLAAENQVLPLFSQHLYEALGEEYPEVLGSIIGALKSIVAVIGLVDMKPTVSEILPRLTPILRNRHEKVQENTIDLVGTIADRAADAVNSREWMRVCFELLDMLKAHKKGIRRAANNTFGFIAKAIGPQDVLATLLNNLRVQERQSRVCTAVAIGIVAETCNVFTVLPSLMNEYRVPELNVQNGVLKAMAFMFEYIGEMAKDYVYAITPLLEDALTDRDQVHRQTAASVVTHIALNVAGLGCEDAMLHLLNLLHPNLFETSPHVIDRVIEAIDAIRKAVGTGTVMNYIWAGMFHPARKVRTPYWRLYNNAYVQDGDALVPYYPTKGIPGAHPHELDIML